MPRQPQLLQVSLTLAVGHAGTSSSTDCSMLHDYYISGLTPGTSQGAWHRTVTYLGCQQGRYSSTENGSHPTTLYDMSYSDQIKSDNVVVITSNFIISCEPCWTRMNGQTDGEVDYKRKYKNLKRKLKFLIYEQECFQEELRRAQRKLLKVSRDKSFLLDRILQYENVDDSSDSDMTASSENSDTEGGRDHSTPTAKRKRSPSAGPPSPPPSSSSGLSLHTSGGPYLSAIPLSSSPSCGGVLPFSPRSSGLPSLSSSSKHTPPPPILSTVPQQMFSDGGEGSGDEGPLDGDEEDDLVIDIPE
ncbi:INO80 complex subunit E isoform X2 [Mixophyes fleayi]|uniref:INO80 complex subunit E isoform X2 n=1 Tax=Mixophyes fleayi TaxID=3061075 RepID=UPI003F4E1A59